MILTERKNILCLVKHVNNTCNEANYLPIKQDQTLNKMKYGRIFESTCTDTVYYSILNLLNEFG